MFDVLTVETKNGTMAHCCVMSTDSHNLRLSYVLQRLHFLLHIKKEPTKLKAVEPC